MISSSVGFIIVLAFQFTQVIIFVANSSCLLRFAPLRLILIPPRDNFPSPVAFNGVVPLGPAFVPDADPHDCNIFHHFSASALLRVSFFPVNKALIISFSCGSVTFFSSKRYFIVSSVTFPFVIVDTLSIFTFIAFHASVAAPIALAISLLLPELIVVTFPNSFVSFSRSLALIVSAMSHGANLPIFSSSRPFIADSNLLFERSIV